MDCLSNEDQLCLSEFIERLNSTLTENCQLPFNLPAKSLQRIVEEAKKYFYGHYDDAVEEMYISLSRNAFLDSDFTRGYKDNEPNKLTKRDTKSKRGVVLMPSNVYSVNGVYEIGGFSGEAGGWTSSGLWNKMDKDFAIGKFIYSNAYTLGAGASGAADNLMAYVVNEYWIDAARQILQNQIAYSYNRLTHLFRFQGELPKNTVIFQVYVTIPDCDLYQDDYFFRYCVAAAMASMSRILNTFTYNLPGNVTLNADSYDSWGKDELEAVKEEMKELSPPDFFLTS